MRNQTEKTEGNREARAELSTEEAAVRQKREETERKKQKAE